MTGQVWFNKEMDRLIVVYPHFDRLKGWRIAEMFKPGWCIEIDTSALKGWDYIGIL